MQQYQNKGTPQNQKPYYQQQQYGNTKQNERQLQQSQFNPSFQEFDFHSNLPQSYQSNLQGANNQNRKNHQINDEDTNAQHSQQGQNLNHTFSEDSENSQVMYPLENKETLAININFNNPQNGNVYEGGRNQIQSHNQNYSAHQEQEQKQVRIQKKKKVLAVITLDLGGDNSDVIQVIEGDDPSILASDFCIKHNLDEDCIHYIIANIQQQIDKRKAKKKQVLPLNSAQEEHFQTSNHTQNNFNHQQYKIPNKDYNIRKSSDSPKFPGLQQSLQGSLQNNYNTQQQQQSLKQGNSYQQFQSVNQQMVDDNNSRKKRPQQPSFGQNQFFEQLSPQKTKAVYEQINEEDQEDQSVSGNGQSANMTMHHDEYYEYSSSNNFQNKPSTKKHDQPNLTSDQQTEFQRTNGNFISPPQINKVGTQQQQQQFLSPEQNYQQIHNNTYNMNLKTNYPQTNQNNNNNNNNNNNDNDNDNSERNIQQNQKGANNNSSYNSNIYNYQQDQDEFTQEIQTDSNEIQHQLKKSQDIKENQEYNRNWNKFNTNNLQEDNRRIYKQSSINQNQQDIEELNKNLDHRQLIQNSYGNQIPPSLKPNLFLNQNQNQEENNQSQNQNELNLQKLEKQQTGNFTQLDQIQPDNKDERKKAIEEIQQKLNIQQKKPINKSSSNQPQKSDSNIHTNYKSVQQPKTKATNLQQQLNQKKEQFFNSYYSQKQNDSQTPNQEENEEINNQGQQNNSSSPLKINNRVQNKQAYLESPQQQLRKSYSNNNLQQYAAATNTNDSTEGKCGAQQSYEQWQKILGQKAEGQKINLKVKRVSSNTPTTSTNPILGKTYSITNNLPSTPNNTKQNQVINQIPSSNKSISPRTLNKNKSATQLNNISQSTNMNKSNQNFHLQTYSQSQLTPHNKLYLLGLDQMERRQKNYEQNLEKSKEREVQGSTFRPSISPQSRNMKLQDGVKLEDYLLLEGRKNKERKAIAALVKDEENNQECKFKPYVSVVSQKLAEHQQSHSQSNFSSIHDRLYSQGLSDIASKEEWSNQQFNTIYPFNPDLGVNKGRKIPENTQSEFTDRLIQEKQVKEAKILAQRQKQNDFIDKQTGQKLFHPKINKDEVHFKVSQRIDLQDKLLQEELKNRSLSPMSNTNSKKGRDVQPPRIGQLQWDEQLRSNRMPNHYDLKKLNEGKGRSVTPRNMKTAARDFEETHYIPLSSRGNTSQISANMEIENILNQSSFRNKKVIIKPISQNKESQQMNIPVINLNKKNIANSQINFHSSQVNQSHYNQKNVSNSNYNNQASMNQSNLQVTMKMKSQLNISQNKNSINPNQTQLQLSAINQFDNGRVFNDYKLSEKIAELFDEFDSDQDGKINAINIDISTTEPEILQIIQNVLFEIDGKNLTLNKNQFTQLLCSKGLIVPLKRYYSDKEGEICDEDMTDYDLIRSNISAINFQNQSYINTSELQSTKIKKNQTIFNQQQIIDNQQEQNKQQNKGNKHIQNIPESENIYDIKYNNNYNNAITNIYTNQITNHIINNSHMTNNNRNVISSKKF